jgi:hypothetical protein
VPGEHAGRHAREGRDLGRGRTWRRRVRQQPFAQVALGGATAVAPDQTLRSRTARDGTLETTTLVVNSGGSS